MKTTLTTLCSLGAMFALTALGQEELADKFKDIGKENRFGLASLDPAIFFGLDLNDGNTDNLGLNAGLTMEGEVQPGSTLLLGIEGNYQETFDETTAENVEADAQYNYTFNDPWYAYAGAKYFYDDIALVDYRVNFGPGIGRWLHRDDTWDLAVEAGPSYIFEEVNSVEDDGFALRFGQRYNRILSDTAKVWQDLEYLPYADDFGDYILNGSAGVEAELANGYGLRAGVKVVHDPEPAEGLDETDVNLTIGLLKSL